METTIQPPPMPQEAFQRAKNRILAGNLEELARVRRVYALNIYQEQALMEAHEHALKIIR